jgi:hypothetical protein
MTSTHGSSYDGPTKLRQEIKITNALPLRRTIVDEEFDQEEEEEFEEQNIYDGDNTFGIGSSLDAYEL